MKPLPLRSVHEELGATLADLNGSECAESYNDADAESRLLHESACLIDLSHRGRLCVIGPDRIQFLHGQVTNDVRKLAPGEGCLAALVDHKGKIQSDLNIHRLSDELLLDFEPGLTESVSGRLNQFIIAEDVEVIDVAPHYGLLSLQGPKSAEVLESMKLGCDLPAAPRQVASVNHEEWGETYLVNSPRADQTGFDLYVPTAAMEPAFRRMLAACAAIGGGLCGTAALEKARILAGIPRYGADMDDSNLVSETGIADEAISYSKGCYIGQEVIARIRTYGRAKRRFCRLKIDANASALPAKGELLYSGERKAGWITSATTSEDGDGLVALGYVAADHWDAGTALILKREAGELKAVVT